MKFYTFLLQNIVKSILQCFQLHTYQISREKSYRSFLEKNNYIYHLCGFQYFKTVAFIILTCQ